jgi:gliding motility-associated lipoprotein GldH
MIKRSKHILSIIVFVLVSFCFGACGTAPIFDENKEIVEYNWDYKAPINLDVNITDTNKYCNIFINLRINGDYKYSNLFMWVYETLPDKTVSKERVEFILADDRGKWLGKGLGDIHPYQLQFKPRKKFKQAGIYSYSLEQNMRDDILANVVSAGVRIEYWTSESKAW